MPENNLCVYEKKIVNKNMDYALIVNNRKPIGIGAEVAIPNGFSGVSISGLVVISL